MPECWMCEKWFATQFSLDQHLASPASAHLYCQACNRSFNSPYSLSQHLNSSTAHTPKYHCAKCDIWFWTIDQYNDHRRYEPAHIRNIHCIGVGCIKSFNTRTAMIQHLESGGCSSGMSKFLVDDIAARVDRTQMFSISSSRLELPPAEPKRVVEILDDEEIVGVAGAPSAASSAPGSVALLTPATDHEPSLSQTPESGGLVLTPRTPGSEEISGFQSPAVILTPKTPFAEEFKGVNPQALANSLERLTVRIIALPPIYFCPAVDCAKPGKTFRSLSSLLQHMEMSCRGCPVRVEQKLLQGLRSRSCLMA